MKDRERTLRSIPFVAPNVNVIQVTVRYNIGGMNYFTGTQMERGLDIHVTPLHEKNGSLMYTGFTGLRTHVLPMKRFSAKTLREYKPDQELINGMVEKVKAQYLCKMPEVQNES